MSCRLHVECPIQRIFTPPRTNSDGELVRHAPQMQKGKPGYRKGGLPWAIRLGACRHMQRGDWGSVGHDSSLYSLKACHGQVGQSKGLTGRETDELP